MAKYVCTVCGFVYDEANGIPEAGIAPGTKWEDLPDDWVCPLCGAEKSDLRNRVALLQLTRNPPNLSWTCLRICRSCLPLET
jgi:rubredoxin